MVGCLVPGDMTCAYFVYPHVLWERFGFRGPVLMPWVFHSRYPSTLTSMEVLLGAVEDYLRTMELVSGGDMILTPGLRVRSLWPILDRYYGVVFVEVPSWCPFPGLEWYDLTSVHARVSENFYFQVLVENLCGSGAVFVD